MIKTYVVFDLETTGLDLKKEEIIEIGALKVVNGKVVDRFMSFVKPTRPITPMITGITGITNEMVATARDTKEIIDAFVRFCEDHILVGHNLMFDYKFMKKYATSYGHPFEKQGIDTLMIARKTLKHLESKSLEFLCTHYQIENQAAHRAYHDALATAKLYHMLGHEFSDIQPELFQTKPLHYKLKKTQPLTRKQLTYLQELLAHHRLTPDCELASLTRSEASRMIDTILSQHGRM